MNTHTHTHTHTHAHAHTLVTNDSWKKFSPFSKFSNRPKTCETDIYLEESSPADRPGTRLLSTRQVDAIFHEMAAINRGLLDPVPISVAFNPTDHGICLKRRDKLPTSGGKAESFDRGTDYGKKEKRSNCILSCFSLNVFNLPFSMSRSIVGE